MSDLTIEGIPASVPRERVVAMLAELGIDASRVTRDGIRIGWTRIQCEVFAADRDGKRYVEQDEIVRHSVAIEITDDPPPPPPPSDPCPFPRLSLFRIRAFWGHSRRATGVAE